ARRRDLGLLLHILLIDVDVQGAGEGTAEAGQVCAAIALRNVVGEAVEVFLKSVVPLQRHFNTDAIIALFGEMKYPVDRILVGIEVLNEGLQTAVILEDFFLAATQILERNLYARVQERQFPDALCQDLVVELDIGEGFRRRPEMHRRPGAVSVTHWRERLLGYAMTIDLLMNLSGSADRQLQFLGQRVDHRHTYAMQTARDLVGVVVELTAGMENR